MRRSEVRARIVGAAGLELYERLEHLDRTAFEAGTRRPRHAKDENDDGGHRSFGGGPPEYDVVFAGGGLSLLFAPMLAARGFKILVIDRARAGAPHREWNASAPELEALVRAGVVTESELQELVIARYRHGICRWFGGGAYSVSGVLDCAVDASLLSMKSRALAEQRGVEFMDRCEVLGHAESANSVEVTLRPEGGEADTVVARLLIDARGASSPLGQPDLVCPTVGGVISGITQGHGPREIDPGVGEILVTTENVEEGRQHVWEAFPGRPGETTLYLFYYARRRPQGALLDLYARFFDRLGSYKAGAHRLVRPTFGVIPGWSRATPSPQPRGGRVLLVGDAAARHSPLTFCGFGSMLRSLDPVSRAVTQNLTQDSWTSWDAAHPEESIHVGTGALARMMAQCEDGPPGALNQLLDAAFATLAEMGNEQFGALLRDEMSLAPFAHFLRRTAARRPRVYWDVVRRLGLRATTEWALHLAPAFTSAMSAEVERRRGVGRGGR